MAYVLQTIPAPQCPLPFNLTLLEAALKEISVRVHNFTLEKERRENFHVNDKRREKEGEAVKLFINIPR